MQPHSTNILVPNTTGTGTSTIELSDDALTAAGMVKVKAFVRSEPTAQAKRTRKHRKKSAEVGFRQVNVVIPESAHPSIKVIAEQLRAGCDLRTALDHALASATEEKVTQRPIQVMGRRKTVAGWRRLLNRLQGVGAAFRAIARRLKSSR